ncbi:MAG: carbohydrate-binding domain-containing protein [Lachnospiraceae bacterium]|nr:carbohydrate-binding domain-containing protein [Lachnospiraceae bacterium]
MSTSKKIDIICLICIFIGLVITVLFMFGEALGIEVIHDEDAETNEDSQYFSSKDLNGDWDTDAATQIVLDGDTAKITGSGAYFYGGSLVITSAGYYVISGELSDGSIIVDANQNSKVFVKLAGVDIYSEDNAAFLVNQADKVFLTIANDTQNTISTGSVFSSNAIAEEVSGAIHAKDDLTINGSGSLTITTGYRHGIKAKDDLVITGGDITIVCEGDGINVNDSFRFTGASVSIDSGGDGIDQGNDTGYIYIADGTIDIDAGDDAINSAVSITIDGGTLNIRSGDDAIHAQTELTINDGTINVTDSHEGLEAGFITINGGRAVIYAEDDCINAGGADAPLIKITGGYIDVTTPSGDTDAIDSNGDIEVSGGIVLVRGGSSSGSVSGSIDVDGEIRVTGGTVIALGGICETPTQDSVNTSIFSGTGFGAGEYVLTDSDGNEVLTWSIASGCTNGWIASDKLTIGSEYILKRDDSTVVTWTQDAQTVGSAGNSGMGPGGMGGEDMSQHGGMEGRGSAQGDPQGMGGNDSFAPDGMDNSSADNSTSVSESVIGTDGWWIAVLCTVVCLAAGLAFCGLYSERIK